MIRGVGYVGICVGLGVGSEVGSGDGFDGYPVAADVVDVMHNPYHQ